jgi:hypothetical protein
MNPTEYVQRINAIVGDDVTDGDIKLNLSWTDRREAKAALARVRHLQAELRFLKQQVAADAAVIRSEFTSRRTAVGKSLGNIVAGSIFGRRNVGRGNALQRDTLRRQQFTALEPYEHVKRLIDAVVHALNEAKSRIETSDEYRA